MDTTKQQKWHDFYPDDLVIPPEDAIGANGFFYRLVGEIPPTRKCFQSSHEDNPNRYKKCDTNEKLQSVYGTSFWSNPEVALKKQQALPEALGDKILACGGLDTSMGKMKQTLEPDHYTIWFKENVDVHNKFFEVGE